MRHTKYTVDDLSPGMLIDLRYKGGLFIPAMGTEDYKPFWWERISIVIESTSVRPGCCVALVGGIIQSVNCTNIYEIYSR